MPRHTVGAARTRALSAAVELFYAHGVDAVSIDDVARTAGVAKNTLYAHFPTKDALAAAALDVQGERLIGAVNQAVDTAGSDPAERINAAFGVIAEMAADPSYRGCPYLNAAAQTPEPSSPVHNQVHAHKDRLRAILRQEVIRTGHPYVDDTADALLLLLDGALVQAATRPHAHPVAIAQRLARGLLADQTK